MPTCNNEETIKKMNELIQLDADAILLYDKALEHIDDSRVKDDLESYKADHERHVGELTKVVFDLGGPAPPVDRDLKGTILMALTAMRSETGTKGALKAMRSNEKLTNKRYDEVAGMELPAPAAAVVATGLADERRHLAGIEAHLERLKKESGTTDEQDTDTAEEVVVVEEEVIVTAVPPPSPRT